MLDDLQTMAFYETYYYAKVLDTILKDTEPYLRNLNNWHEDRETSLFLQAFPKWSVLHDLSEFVIRELAYEQIRDTELDSLVVKGGELWVDEALRHHGFSPPGFRTWLSENNVSIDDVTEDHAGDYYDDLIESGPLAELFEQLTNEVFFLLFGNRSLLANLNHYTAAAMSHMELNELELEHQQFFERKGVLRRAALPEWVRRAVYYRDRGRCVSCNCDLTGLVSLQSDDHFDHIIPLAASGLNDVTNIQLLCRTCNLKKGHRMTGTWNKYERWY